LAWVTVPLLGVSTVHSAPMCSAPVRSALHRSVEPSLKQLKPTIDTFAQSMGLSNYAKHLLSQRFRSSSLLSIPCRFS